MSIAQPTVLVLGGTGMLGHEVVARCAEASFEVHASLRQRHLARHLDPRAQLHEFDAMRDQVEDLITSVSPSTVVNCIGLVKQLDLDSAPAPAIRLNALLPHEIAAACDKEGARLIHISTDCVFAGTLPLGRAYTEQDTPDARDMYGLTKYLGEVSSRRAVTLRTSIIGWELERPSGLLEWLVGQRGNRVPGYSRAIFSGLTTRALARVIVALSENYVELHGLYHVSGDPISKYDLLDELRSRLELDVELIPTELPVINRALDSQRFSRATGLAMPSWEEMLGEYAKGLVPSNDPR